MTKSYFTSLNLSTFALIFFGATLPIHAVEDSHKIDSSIINSPATQPSIFNSEVIKIAQNYQNQSITVFGRTNCFITQRLIRELKARKIPYKFKNVEIEADIEELWQLAFENNKMSVEGYRMPLVEVNDKLLGAANGVRIEQVLTQLSRSKKQTYTNSTPVIIYGKANNKYTSRFIKGLKRRNISYQFKNIDDRSNKQEMWSLLDKNNFQSQRIDLPVISINDKILIDPKFQQILTEISQEFL